VTSLPSREFGSFSSVGLVVYLTDDAERARRLLAGPSARYRRWFHATTPEAAVSALQYGLVPSCWLGGDCCAVCGHDSRSDVHSHQGEAILLVEGAALPGQLKAWWVPASAIVGVFTDDGFSTRAEVLARAPAPALSKCRPCRCGLSDLCAEQISRWRALGRARPGGSRT